MRHLRKTEFRREPAGSTRAHPGHDVRDPAPRPGRGRHLLRRERRPGPPAPEHHRPEHRQAADLQRRRHGMDYFQRRNLQLQGIALLPGRQGTHLPHRHRHRSDRAPVRGAGRSGHRKTLGHVQFRHLGQPQENAADRARPRGHQAALLRSDARRAAVLLGNQGDSARSLGARRNGSRRSSILSLRIFTSPARKLYSREFPSFSPGTT